jgi:hypothetical protein
MHGRYGSSLYATHYKQDVSTICCLAYRLSNKPTRPAATPTAATAMALPIAAS